MREWIKALPLGLGVPIVIGAASVKPEDAASNLSAWAQWLGVQDVPAWLNAPHIDRNVIIGTILLSAIYIFVVWVVPRIRGTRSVSTLPLLAAPNLNAGPSINVPLQAGQIAEIQKLNKLFAGKDEAELRELFDSNNIVYYNLLNAKIPLMKKTDGSEKRRADEFFKGGRGITNVKYISTIQRDGVPGIAPLPGKHMGVNASKKYIDMQNTLARFASSTQLPSTIRDEIKSLSDTAEGNLMLLLDVINENLPDKKEKIINFNIASSPYAHVIENDYNKRTKNLKPISENILSEIRTMLQVK